jgi:hypothetical protein
MELEEPLTRPVPFSGQNQQQDKPQADAAKSEKPDLAVAEPQDLLEHAAPSGRREKWKQSFEHQHQGQRCPERIAVHELYFLAAAGAAAPAEDPRIALKNSDDEGSSTITSLFLLKLAL